MFFFRIRRGIFYRGDSRYQTCRVRKKMYCTHDFFYWSLEKLIKFGYFQFSIMIYKLKSGIKIVLFSLLEKQFCS
jgi:hypothetical protein